MSADSETEESSPVPAERGALRRLEGSATGSTRAYLYGLLMRRAFVAKDLPDTSDTFLWDRFREWLEKRESARTGWREPLEEKVERVDRRSLGHAAAIEKIEAQLASLEGREGKGDIGPWPSYASGVFETLIEHASHLVERFDDKPSVLYHILELEESLGKLEQKARATGRNYEARLAGSLRDLCRVHEPSELTSEQVTCLRGALTALIRGWGRINREKLRYIRARLLDVGLTWLPITDKARADLERRGR